jgi:uncharacterized protein
MYLPRTLEPFIRSSSRNFPSLLVTGPRQVGKTTLLRNLSRKGRTDVTLDDPLALQLAREEPGLFFQRFRPRCLLMKYNMHRGNPFHQKEMLGSGKPESPRGSRP